VVALFLEGFDKYGTPNSNSTGIIALLTQGEWTTVSTNSTYSIVTGLSTSGYALQTAFGGGAGAYIVKTLASSYTRLIGGIRFNSNLGGNAGVGFASSGTQNCTITVNSTGTISLRIAGSNGTAIATSSATISASSTHYLEWDITFGAAAAYQVWMDGVSLFSGTGNTGNGATTANQFNVYGQLQTLILDDLYLFDSTGSANNAALLTSPRVETTFPAADSAVQFGFGAAVLGSSAQTTASAGSPLANSLLLRRYTPTVSGTLNSITIVPASTSATVNQRPVVYADSAGAAGTLMSSGSTVIGTTTGVAMTMPLTTPQSLTAGTQYWLGFMTDTAINYQLSDGSNSGYRGAATFTSGAPGTAPTMTSGQPSWLCWGNISGVAVNWYEVSQRPAPGTPSYVFDATAGQEDLYTFNALSVVPAHVYAVAVKAFCERSDSGAKTVSLRMKSSATDSGGSATGQTPGTTFGWLTSLFETDPNGAIVWTGAALNAATSGFHVDS
jgi:hypothetical protein